ncbi:MAG: hypothetical protein KAS77_03440, partial [Thermoplasmata archaeon]|nr:hypothetical protein [Thermoplasmata archaeon]
DTPIDELTLECSHPAVVGIDGLRITVLYPSWVPEHELTFHVTDAHWRVEGSVRIRVVPVDDAPVIEEIPTLLVVEDSYAYLDLTPYIQDEDTPLGLIRLYCEHPSFTGMDGLTLELLFEEWEPDLWIDFRVSDNTTGIEGRFLVSIEEVNDAPFVIGLGDLSPPYDIHVDEGTTLVLDILVEDEDDTSFVYGVECRYAGVTVHADGTLEIVAEKGDIGEYVITLSVSDGRGGEDLRELLMWVLNVNDAPVIEAIAPPSGSNYYEGKVLQLSALATDEDGDTLLYTWSIGERVLGTGQAIEVRDLAPGEHNITLTVSDGLGGETSSYVVIEILEPGGDNALMYLLIAVVVVVVGVVLYVYRDRLRLST